MTHLRLVYTLLLVVCAATLSSAQRYPLYTQYIFNPYVINPSMVAHRGQAEVNLSYRQQWTGVQNAPETFQFDVQYPFNNRVAVGLNIYNDKTILLSNTAAMLTFGYKVPLAAEHILGFGISGGVLSNRLHLEEIPDVDINDPVLMNASNSFNFDGQFGVNYSYRNFTLGFSLTKLTNNETFSQDELQDLKFDELKNRIAFASYRFNLSPIISLQPTFSYRFTEDDINFFEAQAFVSYKDILDIGGGYRENYGGNGVIRIGWKNLQIGYAYEIPTEYLGVSTGNTNEIQLKLRLGKRVVPIAQNEEDDEDDSVYEDEDETALAHHQPDEESETEETPTETQADKNNRDGYARENSSRNNTNIAHANENNGNIHTPPSETDKTVSSSHTESQNNQTNDLSEPDPTPENEKEESIYADAATEFDDNNDDRDWYLIIGTFEKQGNAQRLVREVSRTEDVELEIKYVPATGYYYVHLPAFKTKDITVEKILLIRRSSMFKDAWFKQLD